ncbi:PREDICTED: putative pentatricopeptide repeat-containing protein At1g28020 [Camelina sativa]|uniref:Pentatricopeptide repeat-containing protein At1g28020 n=1 Tax=Camelina sativa TaxID=90675 RepID=A0ABM1RBH1_CAMSA|nr:PREDICTED: putative pentatricopeptide repeat-containing protein At1g28020 [Camelina sativa]
MTHNLQQHARRILAYSSRPRFFCSYINGTLPSPASNQTLLSRIEAAADRKAEITTVLEHWRQQQQQRGNQLNPSLVRGIVEKLNCSKRYSQALEVSEWMSKQKICNLVPEDFTTRFHLIENVLGLEEAEKFLESIPENLRGESIYTSLLRNYSRQPGLRALSKAESTFKKMRKLGLLLRPSPYNSMTSLYSSRENRDKVDEILQEMMENNVEFDNVTVNNALRVYAAVSDVETMDKFLADWSAITILDGLTVLDMAEAYLRVGLKEKAIKLLRRREGYMSIESYGELMRLYGEAGEREDVYRIWVLYKKTSNKNNEGFRALIGSLLNLDDIKGAEEVYHNEWEGSGLEFDLQILNMLVSCYRKKGMVKKAEKLVSKTMRNRGLVKPITPFLNELGKKGNQVSPSDLRDLIKNLHDSNQLSKALEASSWMCEKKAFNLFSEDYATRLQLTRKVLGLEEAERFFESSIPENMKDYSVYATLLTLHTRSEMNLVKAEAVFEKMRELGLVSKLYPFNLMISLYSELRKRSKVNKLLSDMKQNNIEPDNVTMNNVLRVNADVSAIDSMEKYKKEWAAADGDDNNNITKLEVRTIDAMAKAYERAGLVLKAIETTTSNREVYRLWDMYKVKADGDIKRDKITSKSEIGKIWNEGYRNVISSLLKLEDVKGAEKIYGEWELKGIVMDTRIPCLLISRYIKEDDQVKMKNVVDSSRKKERRMHVEKVVNITLVEDVLTLLAVPSGTILLVWVLTKGPIFPIIF